MNLDALSLSRLSYPGAPVPPYWGSFLPRGFVAFYRLKTREEVEQVIDYFNNHSTGVVLDVETTDKNPRKASLVDVQVGCSEGEDVYIFPATFVDCLLNLSKEICLIGQGIKYDLHVCYNHGVNLVDRPFACTILMGHLVDENRESYSLDSYVKEYWGDDYKEQFWAKYNKYEDAPEEAQTEYACKDIVYTSHLYNRFRKELPPSLVEHVMRLQRALLKTEIEGVGVDINYLESLGVTLKNEMLELGPKMRSLVQDEVNTIEYELWAKEMDKKKTEKGKANTPRPVFSFESTKQLSQLLYGELALPVQKNSKTRAISTDYESLENLKELHPVVPLIQRNRELQKIYGTYIEGTLDKVEYVDREPKARVYPEFRVNGTVTGRISHSNPNLGQLPKAGGIRGIYVPDRGRVLISADYSQLEVVIEANLTADKNLIRMLENGESKHDLTARELGCSRADAKTLNFCLQYWGSHFKVAKLLGTSIDEGLRIWTKYWNIYSGPKELKSKTDKMVDDGIPIETVFGRKRRFPVRKRQAWDGDYRQAYNFKIQSTGADITSRAFYLTSEWLWRTGYGRGMFTVHDELIIEVKEQFAEEAESTMLDIMVKIGNEIGLKIPLRAESSGAMQRWED